MWNFIVSFYHTVFYQPLYNALLIITDILPNNSLGYAVILLTLLIRFVIFPLNHRMIKTQRALKKLEPHIKRIQTEHKTKEEQGKALMELYRAHGINPLSGFLTLLVQIPLLLALFQVFQKGVPFSSSDVYSFVTIPHTVNISLFGLISLTEASIGLAFIASLSQFLQVYLASPPRTNRDTSKKSSTMDIGQAMQKQMLYIFPIMIFFISFKLPAAIPLYWTVMNIFAIVHESIVRKSAIALEHGAERSTSSYSKNT